MAPSAPSYRAHRALIACTVLILAASPAWAAEECTPSVHAPVPEGVDRTPNGVPYVLHPGLFSRGGPPPDGIPSIDLPTFTTVSGADGWLEPDDLLIVLTHKGIERGYPFRILTHHEIVNDTVGGDPIVVTYCPLCGSGIAYERTIDCEPVEFGTSGLLFNSNLVMYDRRTRSLWMQIGGQAVLGSMSGQWLTPIAVDVVRWEEWSAHHPDAEILDQGFGFRDYSYDPYDGYDADYSVWFPVQNVEDGRFHPKAVIFGIEAGGIHKAYFEDAVIENAPFDDPCRRHDRDPGRARHLRAGHLHRSGRRQRAGQGTRLLVRLVRLLPRHRDLRPGRVSDRRDPMTQWSRSAQVTIAA